MCFLRFCFSPCCIAQAKKKAKGIGGWHFWNPEQGSSPCDALAFIQMQLGACVGFFGPFLYAWRRESEVEDSPQFCSSGLPFSRKKREALHKSFQLQLDTSKRNTCLNGIGRSSGRRFWQSLPQEQRRGPRWGKKGGLAAELLKHHLNCVPLTLPHA